MENHKQQSSLIQAYRRYLGHSRGFSPHTVENYISDVVQFVTFVEEDPYQFSSHQIQAITPQHLRGYMDHLHRQKIKANSQSRKISSLRMFFQWAIRHDYCKTDPRSAAANTQTAQKPAPMFQIRNQIQGFFSKTRTIHHTYHDRNVAMFETL
ncbi:MAG: site-specific integrase [Bdellovibrionota bacterium]